MDRDIPELLSSSGKDGVISKSELRKKRERASTTDRYGNATVEVKEDIRVVPPSHLLKHHVSWDTGGAFQRALEQFLDDYYDGVVVLGRLANGSPIEWQYTGVDRSFHQFFEEYPPIVRNDPSKIFKETRPTKRET